MNKLLSYQFNIEQSFREALDLGEFIAYFQPRASISTGKIIGAEALVRWKKPNGELISPANFIPISEETGLIDPLGKKMLEMVCSQIQKWKQLNLTIVPVSVNVSAIQLRSDNFIAHFKATTKAYGIQPHELEVEITESSLIQEGNSPLLKLQELRTIGHKVLLDDFGTGFSSLSYISKLPFDTIKVAQEFMRHQSKEQKQIEVILRAIVALAKGLQKNVMVEGIETADQLKIVANLGFDEYQGYYFSKPLSAENFEKLISIK
jgi:EAL domain-containing protein (putative c-di-GMP-specific phosphodiesterase class I)